MFPTRLFLGLAACLLASTGCALTDITVQPPKDDQLVAPSSLGRGREIVVHAPFADARVKRDRCGMKKNGYNSDSADIHCSIEATDWVARALVLGLSASGYRVLLNQPGTSPTTPRVDGQVVQFFVEPKIDAFTVTPEADIGVTLRVTTPSGLVADRAFYFKGAHETMFGTDDTFQDAADAATKAAVAGMVSAITELLDRYPQLGAAAPAVVSMNGPEVAQ